MDEFVKILNKINDYCLGWGNFHLNFNVIFQIYQTIHDCMDAENYNGNDDEGWIIDNNYDEITRQKLTDFDEKIIRYNTTRNIAKKFKIDTIRNNVDCYTNSSYNIYIIRKYCVDNNIQNKHVEDIKRIFKMESNNNNIRRIYHQMVLVVHQISKNEILYAIYNCNNMIACNTKILYSFLQYYVEHLSHDEDYIYPKVKYVSAAFGELSQYLPDSLAEICVDYLIK